MDFLHELDNFKQKKNYASKCNFFLHFTATDQRSKPLIFNLNDLIVCYLVSN